VTSNAEAVVVGSHDDPHVEAVIGSWDSHSVLVIDASSISDHEYSLHDGSFTVLRGPDQGGPIQLHHGIRARGWIRRLAPPDWQRGLVVDSHEAAVKTAWLSLLVATIRTCSVDWLTGIDALVAAENKLIQHAAAQQLGIPTPETIVCSDASIARSVLGDSIILKALGTGHYYEGDDPFVVYTTEVEIDGPELDALASAPFIAQRRLQARTHLRIVTVGSEIWAGGIEAHALPLDWRQEPAAHVSFQPANLPEDVARSALALAARLELGYSSQDWLLCDDGCFVVDVNPAGQWLFLPDPISSEVSDAINRWLSGSGQ
jgi:hypothetical protein